MKYGNYVLFAVALIASLSASSSSAQVTTAPADDRPNIVLVIADDLRGDGFACTGHPFVQTPTIDQLAAEGIVFRNTFAVTPLCAPSRATLLTGRQPFSVGVSRNGEALAPNTPTLGGLLQASGYRTAYFGKYHLAPDGDPVAGWDEWVAFQPRRGRGAYEGGEGDAYDDPVLNVNGVVSRRLGYAADILSGMGRLWIQGHRDRPFFFVLSQKNVHSPFIPPARHERLYEDVNFPLPASYADPLESLPRWVRGDKNERPLAISDSLNSYMLNKRREENEPIVSLVARLAARTTPSIDDAVKKIRDTLATDGRYDNTVFIVTSDNGFLLGERGLIGKGVAYDPALRVPLVMRIPGATPGVQREGQTLLLDLAPTILELAGVAPQPLMTGRSLLPLVKEQEAPWREDWLVIGQATRDVRRPQFLAVRSTQWKYIRYLAGGLEEELFDLRKDPGERINLATDPAQADTLTHLRARMRDLLAENELPPDSFEEFGGGD